MKRASLVFALFVLAASSPRVLAQKNLSPPVFKSGDTLFYRVHLKINRDIKTKSALSLPQTPTYADLDVQGILQVAPISSDAHVNTGAIRLR